jgi:hypothetical protein
MARPRTDSPTQYEAVRLAPPELLEDVDDADSEAAWDGWISDLKRANGSGLIRAAKLPTDEQGNPLPNSKGQIQLGSWPHDQFDYDSLLAHIRMRFMKPGETIHVRITGTEPGKPGVKVNNIVSLQRDAPAVGTDAMTSQLGEVLTAMREDRAALTTTLQAILTPPAPPAAPVPGPSAMVVMKDIAAVLTPFFAPIIAAWIARPSKPQSDIGQMIEAVARLKDLSNGGSEGGSNDDNSIAGLVKAVAPSGLQLLNTLAQNQQRPAALPPPRGVPPAQVSARVVVPTAPIAPVHSSAVPPAAVRANDGSDASVVPIVHPAPVAPSAPPPISHEDTSMLASLKPHLEELCNLADQSADAVEVAKLTLATLPPEFDEAIADLISNKENFERLRIICPRMTAHAAWFEMLRVTLETEIFEPDSAGNSPAIPAA